MNSLPSLSNLIIAAPDATQPNMLQQLLGGPMFMILVIMGMMYLLWIRPEQKRTKRLREMVQKVKAGDKIISNAGLHGTVRKVADKVITIEIAKGVEVEMERAAIGHVVKPTEESA